MEDELGQPPPPPRPKADGVERRHALVVGIDNYVDPAARLWFCAADAQRIAAALGARGYQVVLVHDGPGSTATPTLAEVTTAIDKVVQAADGDDLVIAYFSCHGTLVDERPHLLMADTPSSGVGGLALGELLGRLRAKPRWVAVFLDVCHMGIAIEPSIGKSADHSLEKKGGFALLSGSTTGGITQDTRDGGIFSKVLHQGLSGAAADPDGRVRFSALAGHVQLGVEAWRQGVEGKKMLSKQTPVLRLEVADLVLFPPHDLRLLEPTHPARMRCAEFSPDGSCLATGYDDGEVLLWRTATATPLERECDRVTNDPKDDRWPIRRVTFEPDGVFLAAVNENGFIAIWTTRTCGYQTILPPASELVCVFDLAYVAVAHFAIASAFGLHLSVMVDPPAQLTDEACVAVVRDFGWPRSIVGGETGGAIRRWNLDAKTSELIGTLEVAPEALAVAADKLYVAAGGKRRDAAVPANAGCARLWLRGGPVAGLELTGHRGGVTAMAASLDGRLATGCEDGVARIFDGRTGTLLRELPVPLTDDARRAQSTCVAWSPDGHTLFVGYDDGRGRLFAI